MSVHGTVSTCDYQMGQERLISFSFELDSKRLKKSGKRHELCFFLSHSSLESDSLTKS